MEIGRQLNNRYTLTARVGQGSMGQVFRAANWKDKAGTC